MPFYEYECSQCKFYTEVLQKVSDPALKKCPQCGKQTLKRLISAPIFRLKGSGWYETDFKSDQEQKRNLVDDSKEAAETEKKPAADEKKDTAQDTNKSTEAKPAQTATDTNSKESATPPQRRTSHPTTKPTAKPTRKPHSKTKPKPTAKKKTKRR